MKKLLTLLVAMLLILTAGCRSGGTEENAPGAVAAFMRQSTDPWGNWLAFEPTDIPLDQSPEALMTALVQAMRVPANPANTPLLDDSVVLDKIILQEDRLILHFNDGLRRMDEHRRLMLCAALSHAAAQCDGVSRIRIRDLSGLIRLEMEVRQALTDPESLRVYGVQTTLFLNRPGGTRLEQVKRTVYLDEQELSLERSLDLLLSLHGVTGLHAPFDGTATGYDLDSSDGICRINIQTDGTQSSFDALDIYGLVNSLAGVEGESRFLVLINGALPSACGIADCDGILFYNTEFIN